MRISTTTLESFRLFCDPEQDWMTEADLIATIKGEFVPTPAVELGKAFGLILETPDAYRVPGGYRCHGYTFDDATLREPLLRIDRRGVFEAKAVKAYGPHDVVAKADHLLGAHLSEFKTTLSTFNFEKYAASCQWRFMADIFEATRITYHVFSLNDHGNTVVTLRGIDRFDLYPYADLHADCGDLLDRFVTYVRAKGLEGVRGGSPSAASERDMGSLNKVLLIGNLGRDADLKWTAGGTAVAHFSIATSEAWTDKSGNPQERTEWHRITLWGKTADALAEYLTRGKQVYVEGKLQSSEYTDKEGIKRKATEIRADRIVLLWGGERKPSAQHVRDEDVGHGEPVTTTTRVEYDDDIPF